MSSGPEVLVSNSFTNTAHFMAGTLQDRCSNLAVLHGCSAMSM